MGSPSFMGRNMQAMNQKNIFSFLGRVEFEFQKRGSKQGFEAGFWVQIVEWSCR